MTMRIKPTTSGSVPRRPKRPPPSTGARRRIASCWRDRLAIAGAIGALGASVLLYQHHFTSEANQPDDRSSEQVVDVDGAAARKAANERMIQRLAAIADAADAIDPGLTSAPVFGTNQPRLLPVLRARLDGVGDDPLQRLVLRFQIAHQLVLAGDSREALRELESLEAVVAGLALPADRKTQEAASLQAAIGLAALRLGEQENCVLNHGASSCLFPIERAGVHALQSGSRRAIEAFEKQLALQPTNLGARWLLNLAHMTVGEYPQNVPRQHLISPEVFRSEHDIKRFRNVAAATGLDVVGRAGGSIMEDFDGDGRLDIMASSWGLRDQLRFFRNDGQGAFVDRTREAGLLRQVGGINLTHADYNNDGHPDVLVIRGGWLHEAGLHPNSLLRNNGDGTFDDVTEAAGLFSLHPTHTAAWGDFDNDGFLDLFVGNEDGGLGTHAVQLYQNNGDGTFADRAPELGFGVLGMVKGVAWGDFDNDGWLDLYVSRFGKPNMLFRNEGRDAAGTRRFTDVAAAAGVEEPIFSFPTWFWDYDNDGWLDIFVGGWDGAPVDAVAARYLGVPHPEGMPRLYRNNGDGTFTDVTTKAKLDRVLLAMGANFGDLDNDGLLDLYIGTGAPDLSSLMPNRMFRNFNGESFQDVTTSGGFGHLQKGHGISFGDLDNDGDQDIHAVMGGWFTGDAYQNAVFENPGHGNHWIAITLEGTRSNRMAVGVRLKVRTVTARGPRDVHETVSSGGSFGGSTLRQEIGLADATSIETIEVTWPVTGRTQVFRDVEVDQFVRIREGEDNLTRLSRRPFTLGSSTGHARAR
jgi:hypothetical protein